MNTYHRTALAALALAPALVLTYCSHSTRTPAEVAHDSVQCILDMETVLRDSQTEDAEKTAEKLGVIHTRLQTVSHSISQMSRSQKQELKKLVEMQHEKVAESMLQCTKYVAFLEKSHYRDSEELEQVTRDIQKAMRDINHRLK